MAVVEINPRYRTWLEDQGLTHAEQFLALPGPIVSGHPDRHVARVELKSGGTTVAAYLKREHRHAWRDRLASAWAGSGFVSKSRREARTLDALRRAGIGCPEWIAVGEDDHGRSFLLIRALTDARDLRLLLRESPASGRAQQGPRHQRRLARELGEALARLHDAGFDHPDLHAKHILVDSNLRSIHFLDCQRVRRRRHLDWQRRWHNLAALDATLDEHLASSRDRLVCLRAYLRATLASRVPGDVLTDSARRVRRQARRLLGRRYVREMRREPLPAGSQDLLWLDGEALCVTRAFHETWQGPAPPWLGAPDLARGWANQVVRSTILLPEARPATLVHRRRRQPLRWLWGWLRGRPFASPEVRQAAVLFRLQRYGVGTPRLLAFGERHPVPWQTESFLLTEAPAEATDLSRWLADRLHEDTWTAERKQRWHILREAASALRAMHEANCHFRPQSSADGEFPLLVATGVEGEPAVELRSADAVTTVRHASPALALRDLLVLRSMTGHAASRTDQLRFFLSYLGLPGLTPAAKNQVRSVLRKLEAGAAS
jgi:tRNA A-37 threonylcarbamoyl transferase component Bud32